MTGTQRRRPRARGDRSAGPKNAVVLANAGTHAEMAQTGRMLCMDPRVREDDVVAGTRAETAQTGRMLSMGPRVREDDVVAGLTSSLVRRCCHPGYGNT